MARFAVSLSGTIPTGTFDTTPVRLRRARESISGLSAFSMGVCPPSAGCFLSAIPSGISIRYFIGMSCLSGAVGTAV